MLTSGQGRLQVFSSREADIPNTTVLDKALDENSTVLSIVMSRDGNYLALGFGRKVLIRNLLDVELPKETLYNLSGDLKEGIESQRLSFSPDGSKFITATHGYCRMLEIGLYDTKGKVWSRIIEYADVSIA
jgi:hypothetical protein